MLIQFTYWVQASAILVSACLNPSRYGVMALLHQRDVVKMTLSLERLEEAASQQLGLKRTVQAGLDSRWLQIK